MKITFTGEHRYEVEGWVSFGAIVDGRRVTNRVSEEALENFFGSDGSFEGDEAAYARWRSTIDGIARLLILDGRVNAYGGADVDSAAVESMGPLVDGSEA